MLRPLLLCVICAVAGIAAEPAADPAMAALNDLRAAGQARSAQAAAEAAWRDERDRLVSLVAAAKAEAARLAEDATAAEQAAATAKAEAAALGDSDELARVEAILTAAGARLRDRLTDLAKAHPPGAVAVPADPAFDAAVRAIDASERAAAQVAVEVVTGSLEGKPLAVRLLRAGGAAAWWASLDGVRAGTAAPGPDGVRLVAAPPDEAAAIRRAVEIAEGRHAPAIVVLPDGAWK
jgi:hypothetical protein